MSSMEDVFRQIVREELESFKQELRKELSTQSSNDYPPVISVKEAAKILDIGITRMYELSHLPGFPAIRTSDNPKAHIKIPTESLMKWINENRSLIA